MMIISNEVNAMRETIITLAMILVIIASFAKYDIVPVTATNDNVNQYTRCIDTCNNNYLINDVVPGKGYTIIIDRHDILNSEDNEIIYVVR